MCENCMIYNKSDTIYYQAARKMLDYGLKLLSKVKNFGKKIYPNINLDNLGKVKFNEEYSAYFTLFNP